MSQYIVPADNTNWLRDQIRQLQLGIDEANRRAVAASMVATAATPVACIFPTANSVAPAGWLLCLGQSVATVTYPDLFAVVGYTYGGSGSSFTIPNYKGRVLVGQDSAQAEFDTLGKSGGEKTHVLTSTEMPSHTHVQNAHTHTQDAHTHTQAAHTHTQAAHTHTQNSHNHSGVITVDTGGSVSWQSVFAGGTTKSGYGSGTGGLGMTTAGATATNNSTTATNNSTTATNNSTTATNNSTTATNQTTGGDAAHNNLPPYTVVNYMIKF